MFSVEDLLDRFRWLVWSSTLRLTLLLSAIFATGMTIAVFVALFLGQVAVLQRIDDTLLGIAAAVEADEASTFGSSVIIQPLMNLDDLPPLFARVAERGGGTVDLETPIQGSEAWRVTIAPNGEGIPVLIGLPLDDTEDALELLGGILWTTTGIVCVLALVIGLAAGLLARRRLGRIGDVLDQLAAGDLNARTGVKKASDDLDVLALHLDETALQLERLVAQTRHLSASIAHDLRTPLARLRSRLETLPKSVPRSGALEEAERLSAIFDTIMRIARIEAEQGRASFEEIDLGSLCSEVADVFGPVVEDSGKQLMIRDDGAGRIMADRRMVIQALANLIQNAIVHGGDDIRVFAAGLEIGVEDDGTGINPDMFEDMLKPMVRGDAARKSDGAGLGLALVRAVADRHGACLSLTVLEPVGFRVGLKFTDL